MAVQKSGYGFKSKVVKLIASSAIGFLAVSAEAQLADSKTRDLLIQKLTQVYSSLAPTDSARNPLTLRLADLHAERARQDAMDELQKGCTVCNAGKDDRQKALRYYQEVLPRLNDTQVAKVLPQVGHLYQMTGQEKLATETYQKVIVENKQPEAVAEAQLSLAEMAFKKRDFLTAKAHYAKVLEIPQSGSKGLAAYRLAWCDFNLGNLEPSIAGLSRILTTPELSSRSSSGGVVQIDRSFQEEVSRDLATFLARRNVTVADAKLIYDLSPETVKLANLAYLAGETERLGQAKSAIELWRFSQDRQTKPRSKVEGHIRLAQLEMEQKNQKAAGQDFDLAMNLWATAIGPDASVDDQAKEMKARLRKIVLDWNRNEKKAPSDELAIAYKTYLKTFPTEADMTVWYAQVLRERKEFAEAVQNYKIGADLFAQQLKTVAKADEKKTANEGLENALLGAIETAELSKDNAILASAYDSYLALSVDRKREIEVLYQKANIAYTKADYATSAEEMRSIAFMTKAKSPDAMKVRLQAADLALDSLVLMKDDVRIEKWAKDFAGLFPKVASDYAKVARKSVLTQAAALATAESNPSVGSANAVQGTAPDYEKAWTVLSRFDLATTTPEDRLAYLKNRLILAEKTGRFAEARDSADQLLKAPGVSSEDKQYALSRKAWLSEMILDFDTALVATEQIQATKEVPEDQRLLKLAMYADLANKDTRPYLTKYLGVSKDEDKQLTIASQLVRESKDPVKELEKQKSVLLKKPEIYARLALENVAKYEKPELAKAALAQKGVSGTQAGRLLTRVVVLDDLATQKAKFAAQKIDGSTQKKLASTLKARIAMIENLEKTAGRAVDSADWTAQLLTLDTLAKESERFYSEILSLPMPQGLSAEDEQQYLGLLSQQAAPYQVKAQDVKKKVDEFWSQKTAVEALEKSLVSSTGSLRSSVVREIKLLASVAPESVKAQLDQLASRPEANADVRPNLAQIEKARQAVREAPMSRQSLENLLSLERQAGRVGMVSYLEGRLQTVPAPAVPVAAPAPVKN
jgi:peptidyl-tRNA hydrolase